MTQLVEDFDFLMESIVDKSLSKEKISSGKKPAWICSCGETWRETIAARKRYFTCPKCHPRNPKKCIEPGCNKGPRYNIPEYGWRVYCMDHSKPGMINKNKDKICEIPECGKRAIYGFEGDVKTRCCDHKLDNTISRSKKCSYKGCTISASFGHEESGIKLRCAKHKEPNMIHLHSKKCKKCTKVAHFCINDGPKEYCAEHSLEGYYIKNRKKCEKCDKTANKNYPGLPARFCSTHACDGMVNRHRYLCEDTNCTTIANFNYPGHIKPRFCINHSESNMVNVIDKPVCEHPTCQKTPIYGYKGGEPTHCATHRIKGMCNIIRKLCKVEGCEIPANFGLPKMPAIVCRHHATPDMTLSYRKECFSEDCTVTSSYTTSDGKRYCSKHADKSICKRTYVKCDVDTCMSSASYGLFGYKSNKCAVHKGAGMIFNPRKKCITEQCIELASHGTSEPLHCEDHADTDEVHLFERECKSCNLITIIGEDSMCEYCSPVNKKLIMRKQLRVKDFLDASGFEYLSYDKIIDKGSCGKERPDFLFDAGTHFVILEVDEKQHSYGSYVAECENTRMINISQALGLPTTFIRYNPDNYSMGIIDPHKRVKGDSNKARLEVLKICLDYLFKVSPIENGCYLQAYYLYYDGWTRNPSNVPILTMEHVET